MGPDPGTLTIPTPILLSHCTYQTNKYNHSTKKEAVSLEIIIVDRKRSYKI